MRSRRGACRATSIAPPPSATENLSDDPARHGGAWPRCRLRPLAHAHPSALAHVLASALPCTRPGEPGGEQMTTWPAAPRRVVVTGMGMLTALGNDVVSTWDGMVAGRSG